MRRAEKEIRSRAEIDEIVRGSRVCRIALSGDNLPYIFPVSFGYDGSAIYIHTAREGKKLDIMTVNNNVCFEFERNVELSKNDDNPCKWSLSYESVIGFGKAHELRLSEDKKTGLNRIMRQYSGKEWSFDENTLEKTRVWKIEIEAITGKRSK